MSRAELFFRLRWRGGCRRRCRRRSIRRGGSDRRFALGLLTADLAARPGEIIGAAGWRRQRLTFYQRPRSERIDGRGTRARSAQQLVGADGRGHQRQDRSGERPRRGLARHGIGVRGCGFGRQRDRSGTRGQQARDFALDIMRELARAALGEIHAVSGTQRTDLAFEVGTLQQEAAGFVDKAIPDIDISNAGLAGRIAIQGIQEQHIRRSLLTVDCGQADPHHRHAPGFQHADHLFNLLGVEFDPTLFAELIDAVRRARALFRGDRRRRLAIVGGIIGRQFGIDRLVVGLGGSIRRAVRLGRGFGCVTRLGPRVLFVVFLVALLVRRLIDRRLAHRDAVVEAEHDDDGVRFFSGEDALGGGGPIGRFAFRLVFDQAGSRLVLADHAHVGLFGVDVFQAIGEPVRHGVAEHQHIALRYGVALGGPRRPGKVLAWRLRRLLLLLLLKRRKEVTAEPAAIAARGLPLLLLRWSAETAEIEELRGRGAGDPDQKRDRHLQRDQRAGFGEGAEKGLWLLHPARSQWLVRAPAIIAESGCKRAVFVDHKSGRDPHRQG